MSKEDQKKLIAEASEQAKAEAKEKGLSKEETKKYIADAVAKVKEENPITNGNDANQDGSKASKTEVKEKEYEVTAPVKDFNGEVAGVQFAYGKAKVKAGWILEWFKEKGYKVEEV